MISQRRAGAILSYIGLAVNAVAAFVYVPLLLSFLTTQEYGVYQLIGSIISYLSVMDMGLSTTLNRFYVKEKTAGKTETVENLLAMAAIIYGILTVLAIVVGLIINSLLNPLLSDSFTSDELSLAHQMMILVILNCIVVLPGNWYLALINANERFVFARSVSILKYVLQVVVVLVVLMWRPMAILVLVVQVALNAVAVVSYVVYVKGKLTIHAQFHHWDWKLFRSLFAFSGFILLNMIFDQIFWKTGQLVLGAVCGAAAVAVYGLVCNIITSGYMQVSTGVTSVFLPKITAISARTEDMTEINALFNKIGRLQAMLVWGTCGGFFVIGADFVLLWAGVDFADAYVATLILMIGLSVCLVQNLGITILQAKNMMGFRAVVYLATAVLDVVVSIPASSKYGVIGCAVVAAVLLFIATGPIINVYYGKKVKIDIPSFWKSTLPLLCPVVITCVVTEVLFSAFPLPLTWGSFIIKFMIFSAVYLVLLRVFWFDDYEKSLINDALRKLKRVKD